MQYIDSSRRVKRDVDRGMINLVKKMFVLSIFYFLQSSDNLLCHGQILKRKQNKQ